MRKHVTDLEILKAIHTRYYAQFKVHSDLKQIRTTKNFVSIDCEEIAKQLNMDAHVLFGRLYYHIDHKYRYEKPDGSTVPLFEFKIKEEYHCINFPYLDGILAGYTEDKSRFDKSFWLSITAIVVSFAALLVKQ